MKLRYLTAGESHGPALTVIVEGFPAGIPLDKAAIDRQLHRRMGGYGRGGRMAIERDGVEILGGVRFGMSLGSPISLLIRNLDHANWLEAMDVSRSPDDEQARRKVTRPRPGHADLAGALKYRTHDARDILERASARETAARTAAGAVARLFLEQLRIRITSRTRAVGKAQAPVDEAFDALYELDDEIPMRTSDDEASSKMIEEIDRARAAGDSIGGVFEVLAAGVPVGLGSHVHWDRKLDGRLAGAMMSIQAVKAVSIGDGVEGAASRGSELHDEIVHDGENGRFSRTSNRAGGLEGGMSNGELLRIQGYLKPLATLPRPLRSVDLVSKEPFEATRERTDTIPIVAAGVVGEAMLAWILADEMLVKFGGDSLTETRRNLDGYLADLARY
jgi:chorismate synthase